MSRDERLLIRSVITTCGDVTTSPFYSRPTLGVPHGTRSGRPRGALSLATTPYVRTRARSKKFSVTFLGLQEVVWVV
jgi:hypothetical protein